MNTTVTVHLSEHTVCEGTFGDTFTTIDIRRRDRISADVQLFVHTLDELDAIAEAVDYLRGIVAEREHDDHESHDDRSVQLSCRYCWPTLTREQRYDLPAGNVRRMAAGDTDRAADFTRTWIANASDVDLHAWAADDRNSDSYREAARAELAARRNRGAELDDAAEADRLYRVWRDTTERGSVRALAGAELARRGWALDELAGPPSGRGA